MSVPDTIKAWEQLPNETDTAYHRFSIYLQLGPDRTMDKVREKVGKKSGYNRQLQRWSSENNWVQRASAYDSHIIKKTLEKREEILDELSGMVLNRAKDLVNELLDLAFHEGKTTLDEGEVQIYNQKLKAIESALDRIGFVRQKEVPDLDKPIEINTYIQNIYHKIENYNQHE